MKRTIDLRAIVKTTLTIECSDAVYDETLKAAIESFQDDPIGRHLHHYVAASHKSSVFYTHKKRRVKP